MFVKKSNGRILLKLGLVLVVLAGVAIALSGNFQRSARVKVAKRDTAVDAVTGSVYVDAEGTTNKELKAESDGKVVACEKIDVGATFKEGEVLLQLETTDLERTIKESKRNYADARLRAHLALTGGKPELVAHAKDLSDDDRVKLFREVNPNRKLAAEKLEQVKRLHQLGNMSDEELRNAERALEQIDLELYVKALDEVKGQQDHEAALTQLNLALDRMQIRAPSDGEITGAFTWKGAMIARGHLVATFMSPERVVSAKISEESFGKVRVGQKARVRLLVYGENNFEATVSKLLPTADDTQRFTVFLDVKVSSPDQLKPRSTGEVTITVDAHPNAVMVPRRAVFDGDKILTVEDGRIRKRQIKLGYVSLTDAEVLEGLAAGTQVIVDELDRFRNADGERVQVEVLP